LPGLPRDKIIILFFVVIPVNPPAGGGDPVAKEDLNYEEMTSRKS